MRANSSQGDTEAQSSRAAPRAPASGLLSLPDDLLVSCLTPLSQQERFWDVALTCKRLRAVCLAPALLSFIHGSTSRLVGLRHEARLASLRAFLAAHGQHVRRFDLRVGASYAARLEGLPGGRYVDLTTACLEELGRSAAASLQRLTVWAYDVESTAWLPQLTALTGLTLSITRTDALLRLPPSFSRLTALVDADLFADELRLEGPLPPSLTRLKLLDGSHTLQLPAQATQLTALQRLELAHWEGEQAAQVESLARLAAIPSLRWLSLTGHGQSCAPPALPALPQLEALHLSIHARFGEDGVEEGVQAMLGRLPALTCLTLEPSVRGLPPIVAQLACLQRYASRSHFSDGRGAAMFPHSLPRGPWLHSLRWLGLSWRLLMADGTVETLHEMPCLDYGFPNYTEGGGERWEAFWRWVGTHPPLRCLGIELDRSSKPNGAARAALAKLQERRPGLLVRYSEQYSEQAFFRLLEAGADVPAPPASAPEPVGSDSDDD